MPRISFKKVSVRIRDFKSRRPHRSFRLSRKDKYRKPLNMPGYFIFTGEVLQTIWRNKKLLFGLILVMIVLNLLLVGLMSQEMYTTLSDVVDGLNEETAIGLGQFTRAGQILLQTITTGGLNQAPTESQQIFSVFIFVLSWLVTVWILRSRLAGHKVKLRDALYNAGAPIISTILVVGLILVQLLPALIALILFSAAVATQFLANPFAAIIFALVAGGLLLLSLYWLVGSVVALVVVTVPGMYPMKAVQVAGDLVTSRRLRVIFRILWCLVVVLLFFGITMIPIIILDNLLKNVWQVVSLDIPIVPVTLMVVSSIAVIFVASYIYLFYRHLVSREADKPELPDVSEQVKKVGKGGKHVGAKKRR